MVMLHHITEEHRAEIRLEYLHFLRPTLGTHYLRESTFLTIISKGRSHHCLAFFAILISLNTLKETRSLPLVEVGQASGNGSTKAKSKE
jgi:hypothetical protein